MSGYMEVETGWKEPALQNVGPNFSIKMNN